MIQTVKRVDQESLRRCAETGVGCDWVGVGEELLKNNKIENHLNEKKGPLFACVCPFALASGSMLTHPLAPVVNNPCVQSTRPQKTICQPLPPFNGHSIVIPAHKQTNVGFYLCLYNSAGPGHPPALFFFSSCFHFSHFLTLHSLPPLTPPHLHTSTPLY